MRDSNGKLNNSGTLAVLVISILFAVAVIGVGATIIYQKSGFRGTYNKAVQLAIDGEYSEAEELFQSIEEHHYKDTDAFIVFCRSADMYYGKGNYEYGHSRLDEMNFENLTDEQNAVIEDFKAALTKDYKAGQKKKKTDEAATTKPAPETTKPEPETTKAYQEPTTKKPSTNKDPYGANEFAHPDDFYYDHVDDFWDYEEAEDYYYENH